MNWTGGLPPDTDYMLPARPENPEMRESASIWLFEENGAFGFPRMGVEAEAKSWDSRRFQGNFAFADGRILNGAGIGAPPSPIGADGRPSVLGAGAMTFQCIEPFRRWRAVFDGAAIDGHVSQQIAKTLDPARRSPVHLEVEMTMAAPAWVQDTGAEKLAGLSETERGEAAFMGFGWRFEQLFRAQGSFTIDGARRAFRGLGLRIHRQSVRPLEGFRGHCWQSVLLPNGDAFGYIAYPPPAEGGEAYNEGYVFKNGRMHAAKAVRIPWLRRIIDKGDDVSLELESDIGVTRISGSTCLSTFRVGNPDIGGLNLHQSGVLYEWDGQRAYGMIERSAHESLTTIV